MIRILSVQKALLRPNDPWDAQSVAGISWLGAVNAGTLLIYLGLGDLLMSISGVVLTRWNVRPAGDSSTPEGLQA